MAERKDVFADVKKAINEIEATIDFLFNLPEEVLLNIIDFFENIAAAPFVAAGGAARAFRAGTKTLVRLPNYVIEDLNEMPGLIATALAKAPEEARKDIRQYLTYKKKVRPLNLIDLTIDILDTILPG